ncbi:outer membrane beta-barrel protein [Bradyrhizobium sp.]|uniref:outer membrane protein n=1 Tax=Bradyrhizobium sp. TaxID=376 RepID=UPI001E180FEB|nr:outer membrane beta-barrel protein [Bradyrhizobium sp.]MBI5321408.1 porin family protein [Bradyrhizobium sp.]
MKTKLAAILAGVITLGAAGAASAADMAVKARPMVAPVPVFSWTGCYIGGHAGWAGVRSDWAYTVPNTTQIFNQEPSADRGVVGGQVGCNYQVNRFVVGGEVDGTWIDVNHYGIMDSINRDEILRTRYDALGSARVRLGFAATDRLLLYVTGGAAFARITNSYENYTAANLAVLTDIASVTSSNIGWVAGGGVQYALTDNWILGGEGLYYEFKQNLPIGQLLPNLFPADRNWNITNSAVVGRIRLDYKFGGPAAVVAKY